MTRGRAAAARLAHNQKVGGSSPSPATKLDNKGDKTGPYGRSFLPIRNYLRLPVRALSLLNNPTSCYVDPINYAIRTIYALPLSSVKIP